MGFVPRTFVIILVLVFGLFAYAHAQVPLTLPEVSKLALDANDPSVTIFEERALALEDRAVADSRLPDPVIMTRLSNLPLASFDYNREPMTQLQVGLKQQFPKGDSLKLAKQKRKGQATDQRMQKHARELQIVQNARKIWLELYYWREARNLTLQSRKKVEELGGVAEAVYASGHSSLQGVLRVDLETTALDAKLIDIDRQWDVARADLQRLIGDRNASRPLSVHFPVLSGAPSEQEIRNRLPSHPILRALDARISTRTSDVSLAKQQFKPSWTIDAAYGLRDSRSDFGSIGVSAQLPLWSRTKQDYALQAAKRDRAAQRLARDVQALELDRFLRRQSAEYKRLGERIISYEREVSVRARETSEAALTAYANQQADFSEVIRAELAVLDIDLTLLRLRIDQVKAQADLLYLSGE